MYLSDFNLMLENKLVNCFSEIRDQFSEMRNEFSEISETESNEKLKENNILKYTIIINERRYNRWVITNNQKNKLPTNRNDKNTKRNARNVRNVRRKIS